MSRPIGSKLSDSHRLAISNANKGKKRSLEIKQKMKDRMTGKKFSDATKKKMADSHKGKNKQKWSLERRLAYIKKVNTGRTVLRTSLRNSKDYKDWRENIFKRDNYTCQICTKQGGNLNADHHPVPFAVLLTVHEIKTSEDAVLCKELWKAEGRTLCVPCHRKTDTYSRKLSNKSFLAEIEKYKQLLQ